MNTQKMRLAALVLVAGLSGAAQAATTYSVTNLGALGGAVSYATGINNSGQVVGHFDVGGGYSQAFLYSGGNMTDLGTLGGSGSYAYGINDSGQVVGTSGIDGFFRAFSYSNGVMTQLSDAGGVDSYATGINDSGQVVGQSWDNQISRAFLNDGGVVTFLSNWNTTSSNVTDINNSGQIVGISSDLDFSNGYPPSSSNTRAVLYSGGSMTDLGTLGGNYSYATGINDSGQIVGISDGHAFLYSSGSMTDLGALIGSSFYVGDINNSGQVVGASGGHAFLYSDGVMTDLNSLIDPLSGWTITGAIDINDSGQIAANGCNATGCFALLLSTAPVPEPETYAMLLAGLGMVGFAARRRARVKSIQEGGGAFFPARDAAHPAYQ